MTNKRLVQNTHNEKTSCEIDGCQSSLETVQLEMNKENIVAKMYESVRVLVTLDDTSLRCTQERIQETLSETRIREIIREELEAYETQLMARIRSALEK